MEGVTENILKKLHEAVGFIAIMHPRGNVFNSHDPERKTWVRGSVWVEQEVAIAAFISQALQLPLRVRAYVHEDIRREGLRDNLHLNPKLFREDPEILTDLTALLPSWSDLVEHRKEPFSLMPKIYFRRAPVPGGGEDRRYEVTVTVENDGEQSVKDYAVNVEFPAKFVDGSAYIAMKRTNKPGVATFEGSNKNQQLDVLVPGGESTPVVSFFSGITAETLREHPAQLEQSVRAVVSSGNMTKTLSTTLVELINAS